ncbi:TPA: hypothetical protein N0F65_009887 [Lagenidium giganteum]|uniref:Uncharacterized protein n=1 Tax=Lagenidium giganteum TaxID=4803 RepID=A0AAV2YUR5_9STRA|nr:TPA: hypothetical protein N0F65_009887 [Lagenidium giganteum]
MQPRAFVTEQDCKCIVSQITACIHATILTGTDKGNRVFIPRVTLISDGKVLPFKLRRQQFPVQIAFSLTINKAQGQSILYLGIYLPQPVFAHGQMYVGFSRSSDKHNVKVAVKLSNDGNAYTMNIVYTELL